MSPAICVLVCGSILQPPAPPTEAAAVADTPRPNSASDEFPDNVAGRSPDKPNVYSEVTFIHVRSDGAALGENYTAETAQVQKRIQYRWRNVDGTWPAEWTEDHDGWWPSRADYANLGTFYYVAGRSEVLDAKRVEIPADYRRDYLAGLQAGEPFYQQRQKIRLRYFTGGEAKDFVSDTFHATAVVTGGPDSSPSGGFVDFVPGRHDSRVAPYPQPAEDGGTYRRDGVNENPPYDSGRTLQTLQDVEWIKGLYLFEIDGRPVLVSDRREEVFPLVLSTRLMVPLVDVMTTVPAELPTESFAVIGLPRDGRMRRVREAAQRGIGLGTMGRYRLLGPPNGVRASRMPQFTVFNGYKSDQVLSGDEPPQVYVSYRQYVDVPVETGIVEGLYSPGNQPGEPLGGEYWQYRVVGDDQTAGPEPRWCLTKPLGDGGRIGMMFGTVPRPYRRSPDAGNDSAVGDPD